MDEKNPLEQFEEFCKNNSFEYVKGWVDGMQAIKKITDAIKVDDIPSIKQSFDDLKNKVSETSETSRLNAEIIGTDGKTRYNKNLLVGNPNRVKKIDEDFKVSAERTQKMINLQTIHVLTSGGKIDPDIYKGMLELIEPAKKGEYKEHDIFTVVDADKDTDGVAGEGNLVFVYVNDKFTYDAQTLKDLEELEDKVTVIKYADLVKQD